MPFDGEFLALADRITTRYVSLADETRPALQLLPTGNQLDDLAIAINLKRGNTGMNLFVGPMRESEFSKEFSKSDGFPSVGLYVDVDCFTTEPGRRNDQAFNDEIAELARTARGCSTRVRDLIFAG